MRIDSEHSLLIKKEAIRLGFKDCGISPAGRLDDDAIHLGDWLDKGFQGDMACMNNYFGKRTDPRELLPGAESVISVILNYFPTGEAIDPGIPKISKYAWGRDYHKVMKKKMKSLMEFMSATMGPVKGTCFVDSAPVLDKAWAAKSGLGWIGKNSILISRKFGSFVFIGELIVDMNLAYDLPVEDHCGDCTRCIDACPTEAIVADKIVDSRKCISYQTVENKKEIEEEMKGKMGNWIFGCDICQDVCPWNQKHMPHQEPEFNPHPDLLTLTRKEWFEMDEERFNILFSGTPVMRAKYSGLKRNLKFIQDKKYLQAGK